MLMASWTAGWYLEAKTLNLITSLEALDAGLGTVRRLPPAQFRKLRDGILTATPDEHRAWIRAVVQNNLSLQDRLKRLAGKLPAVASAKLLPSVEVWARAATRVRNDLSHSGATSIDFKDLAALGQITEAVAYILLLGCIGVPDTRIEQLLLRDGELAYACQLAAEHFTGRNLPPDAP
jgi:hypothetical protein